MHRSTRYGPLASGDLPHRGWVQGALATLAPGPAAPAATLTRLLGTYVNEHHGTRLYGKAVHIARRLRAAYDAVLATDDLPLMPTTPVTAHTPAGVMLVGRHFDEATIYRAAYAFEQSGDWRERSAGTPTGRASRSSQ